MVDLTRYDPFEPIRGLQREMNKAFGRTLGGEGDASSVATAQWVPSVDIKETTDKYLLYADLPGVDPQDIELTMENGVLTIRGERAWQRESEEESYTRVERAHGMFYRRFALPDSADPENIEAHDRNGVLEIVIPKSQKSQRQRIPVAA